MFLFFQFYQSCSSAKKCCESRVLTCLLIGLYRYFGSCQSLYIKLLNSNLACTAFIIKKSIAYHNLCSWSSRMFQFFTPPSFYYRTLVYIMIASKTNNVASRYGHRKCVNILIIEYAFFNFIKEDLVSQQLTCHPLR